MSGYAIMFFAIVVGSFFFAGSPDVHDRTLDYLAAKTEAAKVCR